MLALDLAAFSLIFPLIPAVLTYYLPSPGLSSPKTGWDSWLYSCIHWMEGFMPQDFRSIEHYALLLGGLIAALYALSQFLVAPYWGRFSDRIGRKPVLLMNSLGLAFSYLLWFFASSFSLFCIARFLGSLMGGNLGVASAAMADMSPPEKRTAAMGLLGAAFGAGFLLGPLLGGLSLSWDLGSWGVHPFSGAALSACLLSLLSLSLNLWKFQETAARTANPRPWISKPFAMLRRISTRAYKEVVLIHFLYVFIFSAYEFSFSYYYSFAFQLGADEIAFLFLYLGLCFTFAQGYLARILSKRWPPSLLLYAALACVPVPLICFGLSAPYVWLSLVALFFLTLASALVLVSLASLASITSDPAKQGYAMGTFRSFAYLARALSPILGAALYWSLGASLAYMILSILLALLLLYTLSKRSFLDRAKATESTPNG